MKRVSLRDATWNMAERGSGPVLLLVHGFPLDHSMWRHQLDFFSGTHRVIAPDLRGFGASSSAPETLTMQQLADDLAELLDRLDVEQPIALCGLSMGGYVAWQFWQRHAPRLDRLILCDTRAIADTEDVARGRMTMAERVLGEGAEIVAETMLPKLFAETTVQQQPDIVESVSRVMQTTAPATMAAALRGMAQCADMTSRLPEIDVPALLICGDHDVISPPDEMRAIAQAMPRATFCEIADSGHMAPLERPSEVNEAIARFLS